MTGELVVLERFDGRFVKITPASAPALPAPNANAAGEENAHAEGYEEGFAAGRAAAASKGEQDARLLTAVAAALEAQSAAAPERIAREAAAALMAVLEKVFPTLSETGFAIEAAAAFSKIAESADALAIDIVAAPGQAKEIKDCLARLSPEAKFSIRADDAMKPGAAKAAWSGGGADFDIDAAANECLAAMKTAINKLATGDQE